MYINGRKITLEDLEALTTENLTGRILTETQNTTDVQTAEGRYQIYIH